MFSLMGICGLGSLLALVIGWKARKLILASGGEYVGLRMAWWCIIVGGAGSVSLPLVTIYVVVQALKSG